MTNIDNIPDLPDLHPPSSRRRGVQLCMPFEEKRLHKWDIPGVIVQPKLDGERCRAVINYGHVTLLSSEEHEIISVPHINHQLAFQFKEQTLELDGELYLHGASFEQIHSMVSRREHMHEYADQIKLHIFDIVTSRQQVDRLHILSSILGKGLPNICLVPSQPIPATTPAIMEALKQYSAEGFEGIIIRHPFALYERKRSLYVMKFKAKKEDIYEIIGVQEEVDKYGNPKGTLGALICTSDEGTTFGVGTGLSAAQRRELWQNPPIGKFARVMYQAITPKHVPRFPVLVEVLYG